MHKEPKPAVYLAATLASEAGTGTSSYRDAVAAETLVRLGKRAARIAVQRCNGIERYDATARRVLASWTDADEERADKAVARIEAEAAKVLQPYGATDIKAHGDPRGFVLTFRLASSRSNSFGGGVWGV
ncbi:DUF885 domain-containing protein [Mesorhizobium sp. M0045]|uniref:hypothetical protein n=1 Tax=Mesorhizobium sp. M0045 TaxID=2956857 RepID=UPI003337DECD